MSKPDFEIGLSLRGRQLTTHVSPDSEIRSEGEGVKVDRTETRTESPAEARASAAASVGVEKRVIGRLEQ